MKELINRIRGQVRIRVECAFPERVLNLCGARDLAFWDLEWESPTDFSCRLSRRDYHTLRKAAKRLDCTITPIRREGVPYFLGRFRKRYALLAGLFIIIDGLTRVGIIADISNALSHVGGGSPFLTYTIVVWASVLFSAFIDNIPYTAAMLPVMAGAAGTMGIDQTVLCFGLLVGATLGGNLTPVGASANITSTGILEKEGYNVSTRQFMRIGVPFTLVAVLSGYLLVWIFYGM